MGLDPAVAATRRAVRSCLTEFEAGDRVVVACSGGADSMALLDATIFEARKLGLLVIAVTVDHGLQSHSTQLAARVVDQARGLGAHEAHAVRVEVSVAGDGLEAAARRARYAALVSLAHERQARAILVGHTLDDQAETVLLGLTRGSGARSLAGMRASTGLVRRPFLGLSRETTHRACVTENLQVHEDPHNQDPRFTRVRIRREVLPFLESELGPGVTAALARTAHLIAADADYLDQQAQEQWRSLRRVRGLPSEALQELPSPLLRRVLRLEALAAGAIDAELFAVHLHELERLVTEWRGQGPIDLPGHLRCRRADGELIFEAHSATGEE